MTWAIISALIITAVLVCYVRSEREQNDTYRADVIAQEIEEQRKQEEQARKEREERWRKEAQEASRKAKAEDKKRREAATKAKQQERLQYAREMAELKERALKAEKELRALKRDLDAAKVADPKPAATPAHEKKASPVFTQTFKGQVVAFTGKIPGMTRAVAIEAVRARGGKAFTTMPAGTTLLVVGNNPGMNKMDKADEWIGQVRKITVAQFNAMLAA